MFNFFLPPVGFLGMGGDPKIGQGGAAPPSPRSVFALALYSKLIFYSQLRLRKISG